MLNSVLRVILLLLCLHSAFAQELSQRQDLAISLIHYSEEPPYQAIASIDAHILQVFQSTGSFNITVLPRRIEDLDAVTTEDYPIVVVPQLSQYELTRTDNGYWQAEIIISFSIFRAELRSTQFFLEFIGYDLSAQEAFRQAVDELPSQLSFRLRSIEELYAASFIIERFSDRVVLGFGSDSDVAAGDEYELVRPMEEGSERIALVRVRETIGEFSVANIIYRNGPLSDDDQIRKLPRIGVNIQPYFSGLFDLASSTLAGFSVGTRVILARGVYNFRPSIGFEVIVPQLLLQGFQAAVPLSASIGVEYSFILERFSIIPQVFFAAIGQSSQDMGFSLTYLQTSFLLGLSLLLPTIHDNFELYVEGGYVIRSGLAGNVSTQGISAGLGVRIR